MKIGIPKETYPNENRVALVPALVPRLREAGLDVIVETGAGHAAGFPDQQYQAKGAEIIAQRSELLQSAGVLLQVRTFPANPDAGMADLDHFHSGQILIGLADPLTAGESIRQVADKGLTLLALELMPRISRAQSMDVLSSMASIAGYKAVLLAADALPKMFPMMMTAAGTIKPARVFVIGAGVAGLQAIATAKRLGALVEAYDLRPEVKEQIESLGAKFVSLDLQTGDTTDKSGYAKTMDEAFYKKQREKLAEVIAEQDVVITTAAVPGRKAPLLITEEAVKKMAGGSVIVDLASEQGGNCELAQHGKTRSVHDVTIIGLDNLPSTIPYHASQMYAKNISTFLLHLTKDKSVRLDPDDEITRETLVCRDGQIVHPRLNATVEKKNDATNEPRSTP